MRSMWKQQKIGTFLDVKFKNVNLTLNLYLVTNERVGRNRWNISKLFACFSRLVYATIEYYLPIVQIISCSLMKIPLERKFYTAKNKNRWNLIFFLFVTVGVILDNHIDISVFQIVTPKIRFNLTYTLNFYSVLNEKLLSMTWRVTDTKSKTQRPN